MANEFGVEVKNHMSVIEDEDAATQCVCGHENLRYLFTIKNVLNGNEVFPIGSTCIKKFERTDLDDKATIDISMFKLMHVVTNGEFIKLKGGLFTRKIIKYLYDNGYFVDNEYNQNCAYNDYEFFKAHEYDEYGSTIIMLWVIKEFDDGSFKTELKIDSSQYWELFWFL